MNRFLAKTVLEEALRIGVREFCISPGARSAPFVYPLAYMEGIKTYYWPEERSAAFFALGRIKAEGRPVAVVTTSGTAAAELLPATMEAYYSNDPLLLLTADRPRRFRGTGAPQAAEQVGLFTCYAQYRQDLEGAEICSLKDWDCQGPAHLNICFEEPKDADCQHIRLDPLELFPTKLTTAIHTNKGSSADTVKNFIIFIEQSPRPLVVLGGLLEEEKESVVKLLLHLKAPVYAEAMSGLREDPRLESLRISFIDDLWSGSERYGYSVNAVLRIGSVPTTRIWRDLELLEGKIKVCSLSRQPFSGLSWGKHLQVHLDSFVSQVIDHVSMHTYVFHDWKIFTDKMRTRLEQLFLDEPLAEPSLMHTLSDRIPKGSKLYLGNSLPIREWDQCATREPRHYKIAANRGVNGIDGQLATFLGYSCKEQDNWAIVGDLTALYDLIAPWVSRQLMNPRLNIIVVNNGGGQIFSRMFAHEGFLHSHGINFRPMANLWNWNYECWERIPEKMNDSTFPRIIELLPDNNATKRFHTKLKRMMDGD